MPGLVLIPLAVSEELKETDRHTDRITFYILDNFELTGEMMNANKLLIVFATKLLNNLHQFSSL